MPAVNDSIPPRDSTTAYQQQNVSYTDSLTVEQLLSQQPDSTATRIGKAITANEMYGTRATFPAEPSKPYTSGDGLTREYPLGDSWAFIPLIGVLLLALLLLRYTRGYLSKLFLLLISKKTTHKQYKANIQNFNRILFIITLFSIVPATIFTVYILNTYPNQLDINAGYEIYLIVAGFFLAYSIIKGLILTIAGVLTYSQSLIHELRYNSRIFLGSWGIIALSFILLLTLNENEEDKAIFFLIVSGISIFLFILYLARSLQLFVSEKVSILFWILYLCVLELLPALLVFDYLFPFK